MMWWSCLAIRHRRQRAAAEFPIFAETIVMKLFGLQASRAYAEDLARNLGVELSTLEEREFEDTEFKIRPLESVRAEQVFVCQSLAADSQQSANDKLCRALFFVGALKDAAAASVVMIAPYLAYARKDRRTKSRDPVTIRYVAQMFESVGADAIVTADVHNLAAFENAFRCGKENVEAAALFADHFLPAVSAADKVVVLSPDAGGVKRARAFAELLAQRSKRSVDLAFMEKHRSEGRVWGELFAGDVADATVIVIDDLISGGTTMARAALACVERGAKSVHAAATHAVFGAAAVQNLAIPELESVVVTDTIRDARDRCPDISSKLVVLPSAPLFSEAIRRLANSRPTM